MSGPAWPGPPSRTSGRSPEGNPVIPRTCRRLAEVDFPIAVVSKHAAREKSIRHGHPSTLHLWWARRPLASSRAVLLALLLPDPCDEHCPEAFKEKACAILGEVRQPPADDMELRKALLWFIGAFANWDMAANQTYLNVGRNLVRAAHGEAPLVVDPFAGGGSIPLEALRLGCEAFASDLNPVACLILKVLLEDIPRHGPRLADELRRTGGQIKAAAEKKLADLYPPDPDGATPIAYLWARTVRCEAPNCGAEIPLMRSLWLCKKNRRKRALRPSVRRGDGNTARVEFEIFEPRADKDVRAGTVTRAKATCVSCRAVLPPKRVRAQLAAQRGGADVIFDKQGRRTGGAFLLAVVTLEPGKKGRRYRLPTERDYKAVHRTEQRVAKTLADWDRSGRQGFCPVPDEPISLNEVRRISVPIYGMREWGDLFTARQKAALWCLSEAVRKGTTARQTMAPMLACAFSRVAMSDMSCTRWNAVAEKMQHTFGRQAIPIVWDFAEVVVTAPAPGNWESGYDLVCDVAAASASLGSGQVQQADATAHPLPDQSATVWFTDPPYYDAVPYAHLADFFFVWLKRTIPVDPLVGGSLKLNNSTTPKACELVVDRPHRLSTSKKDAESYERGMAQAFAEGRRVLREDGITSVVFAHKTTEGWEALLSGMIRGGWTITGSWPIATEMGARLNARETASLATSIHLICRPRPEDAPTGDWSVVLRELPSRVGEWMERLQTEGIRGADLVFACIGPALEIFSRYSRVETPDGSEIGLPTYLEKVWEVVGRTALENVLGGAEAKARNGLAGALEEDARLTALFLWTLQATSDEDPGNDARPADDGEADDREATSTNAKGFSLVFDVVRRFAQPLGIDLPKWENRTIETRKGVVRLLPVAERAKQLFGDQGAQAVADWLEHDVGGSTDPLQGVLFPNPQENATVAVRQDRRRYGETDEGVDDRTADSPGTTTLDRVHTGMLLQASGQTNALHALVRVERERGPDFMRLSNALSALYPRDSEEKRLVDAMLLAAPSR